MRAHNCKKFIFSSSATVYGDPATVPITEDFPTGGTTNPYGTTKLFIEQILKDIYNSDNSWDICILRYFNPVGAHESGLIGEEPQGIPNNLMPYVARVAAGILPELSVFGNDYDTPDGTGEEVKYKIAPRRSGDIAKCYADPAKAKIELGWVAEKNLDDMCKDSWHYIEMSQNQ